MAEEGIVRAACHCKAVQLKVRLAEGLEKPLRCTCSLCRMRGAVVVMADRRGVEVLAGESFLTEYRFNTGVARHYFCSRCGVYTHHQRRMDPEQVAVNVACIEGVSPFDFAEVPVVDGVNHPKDIGLDAPLGLAGVLRFERGG